MAASVLTLLALAASMPETGAHDVDHSLVLAIGPSAEIDLGAPTVQGGAQVSVEFDAIEHWLELELGVQALAGGGAQQLSVDFLFKKPFALTHRLSVMPGLGPQVVRTVQGGRGSTLVGVEAAVDVMWRVFSDFIGLGAEPSFGVTFGPTTQCALGLTLGPIIG